MKITKSPGHRSRFQIEVKWQKRKGGHWASNRSALTLINPARLLFRFELFDLKEVVVSVVPPGKNGFIAWRASREMPKNESASDGLYRSKRGAWIRVSALSFEIYTTPRDPGPSRIFSWFACQGQDLREEWIFCSFIRAERFQWFMERLPRSLSEIACSFVHASSRGAKGVAYSKIVLKFNAPIRPPFLLNFSASVKGNWGTLLFP